jgi:hypothetical protein
MLLYGDFLHDAESLKSQYINDLIIQAEQSDMDMDMDDNRKNDKPIKLKIKNDFIDIQLQCIDQHMNTIRIPPIRIQYIDQATRSDPESSWMKSFNNLRKRFVDIYHQILKTC